MLVEALEHVVRGIVAHPDDVRVSTRELRRGRTFEVRVHPEDFGRVIGRRGRTAQAIRTVVGALDKGRSPRIDFVEVGAARGGRGR
ncbi:RNA-binding protein [Actinopolymorpha sp. NPDC004070]|jgi:predicted RNA-binding protein YlqC (UPF0109 family)|uniref:RNA-binding protein n=1 Tax=Actinopolymorpha sp. NPDC004070 TaxID=3154548 RepID=UPI0033A15AF9